MCAVLDLSWSQCGSVWLPQFLHSEHGNAVKWLPVSMITDTRWGGVPAYTYAKWVPQPGKRGVSSNDINRERRPCQSRLASFLASTAAVSSALAVWLCHARPNDNE